MLEWVDEGVRGEAESAMTEQMRRGQEGAAGEGDPLVWKFVKVLERRGQVERALRRRRPGVVLASETGMEWGFSRQALRALAGDSKNLVVLTESASSGETGGRMSLGRQLHDLFHARAGHTSAQSGAKVVNLDGAVVSFQEPSTEALNPEEAAAYETYQARQRAQYSSLAQQGDASLLPDPTSTSAELTGTVPEEEDPDSSSDEEDEADEDTQHQGRALNLSAQITQSQNKRKTGATEAELGVNILLQSGSKKIHDYDVRGRKGREKMFPFAAQRGKGDEFGEMVRGEEFLRAEERDEVAVTSEVRGGDRKRKWGGGLDDGDADGKGRGRQRGGEKRRKFESEKSQPQQKAEPDGIDALIARATGESLKNGGAANANPNPNSTSEANQNNNDTVDSSEEDQDGDDDSEESDYDPADDPDAPKKLVWTNPAQELEMKCKLAYVDFSGVHEKRDLLMLLPLVRPRKVILMLPSAFTSRDSGRIEGDAAAAEEPEDRNPEREAEVQECRQLLQSGSGGEGGGAEVFAPSQGERVDASMDSEAWMLKLGKGLVRRLKWQSVGGVGVVALTGMLHTAVTAQIDGDGTKVIEEGGAEDAEGGTEAAEEEEGSSKNKVKLTATAIANDEKATKPVSTADTPALPVLDLPTQTSSSTTAHHRLTTQPVHVGDLRLASLRQLLQASGHLAEFRGEGTLLVDACVVVRKGAGGRIEVEGLLGGVGGGFGRRAGGGGGASFYEVKKRIYSGLAVVAGV